MLSSGWESVIENASHMRRMKSTYLSSTESCSKEEDSDETETTAPDSLSGSNHVHKQSLFKPQAHYRNMSSFRNSVHGFPVPATMAFSGGKEQNSSVAHPWVFSHPSPMPYIYPMQLQAPFHTGAVNYNSVPDLPKKNKPKKLAQKNRTADNKTVPERTAAEEHSLPFLNHSPECTESTALNGNGIRRRFSDSELYKLPVNSREAESHNTKDPYRETMSKKEPPVFQRSEEDGDISEGSSESIGEHHLSRLITTLMDELRSARQLNRQLWLELHQTRLELEAARSEPKGLMGASYQPGYISSLVHQIYTAQRLREEAISNSHAAKPWHSSPSQSLLADSFSNGHKMPTTPNADQLSLQRDALMFRLQQTEKQIKQLDLDGKEREFSSWHEDYMDSNRRISQNIRSSANSARPSSSPGLRPVAKDCPPSVNSFDGRRTAAAADFISNRAQSLPVDLTVLSGSQEEDNLLPNAVHSALHWTPRLTRLSEPRLDNIRSDGLSQVPRHIGLVGAAAAAEVTNAPRMANGVALPQRHRASPVETRSDLRAATRLLDSVQWTAEESTMTRTELEAQIALLEKDRTQLDQDLQATLAGRRESEERVVRLERLVGVLKKKLTQQKPGSLSEASIEHSIDGGSNSSASALTSPNPANMTFASYVDNPKQNQPSEAVPHFFSSAVTDSPTREDFTDSRNGSVRLNRPKKMNSTSSIASTHPQEPSSPSLSGPKSLPSYVRILGPVTEL